MRRYAAILLVISLIGCSFSGNPVEIRPKALEIKGEDVTSEQKGKIHFALDQLPEDFKNSLKIIDIIKDREHFEYLYKGTKRYAIGHANSDYPDKVCLRYDSVDSPLVWHEIAHAYAYASYSFERKWERLAGDVYDENNRYKERVHVIFYDFENGQPFSYVTDSDQDAFCLIGPNMAFSPDGNYVLLNKMKFLGLRREGEIITPYPYLENKLVLYNLIKRREEETLWQGTSQGPLLFGYKNL